MFENLRKFFKKKSKQEGNQFTFPTVISETETDSGPMTVYDKLEERVRILEQTIVISQDSVEKFEFPEEILNTLPAVIKKTIEGIIFSYEHDFPVFCFMGMRKALIDGIRICFQMKGIEEQLYDESGNPYRLPKWIEFAKQKRFISNNIASDLTAKVKVFGDSANHDYMTNLQKEEVPAIFTCLRMALSRMFYSQEPAKHKNN